MQAVADSEGHDIRIEPWDYRYYAELVRRERYDLDSDEVKQYLQLDKLRDAMFFVSCGGRPPSRRGDAHDVGLSVLFADRTTRHRASSEADRKEVPWISRRPQDFSVGFS
jgi:hypothetical protein